MHALPALYDNALELVWGSSCSSSSSSSSSGTTGEGVVASGTGKAIPTPTPTSFSSSSPPPLVPLALRRQMFGFQRVEQHVTQEQVAIYRSYQRCLQALQCLHHLPHGIDLRERLAAMSSPHPILPSEEEVEDVQGQPTTTTTKNNHHHKKKDNEVEKKKKYTMTVHSTVLGRVDEACRALSFPQFLWCFNTVASRGFFFPLETWALMPYVDYFNYCLPSNGTMSSAKQRVENENPIRGLLHRGGERKPRGYHSNAPPPTRWSRAQQRGQRRAEQTTCFSDDPPSTLAWDPWHSCPASDWRRCVGREGRYIKEKKTNDSARSGRRTDAHPSSSSSSFSYGYARADAYVYVFRTRRPLIMGEQVFLCYGTYSDTELLLWYGFTLRPVYLSTSWLVEEYQKRKRRGRGWRRRGVRDKDDDEEEMEGNERTPPKREAIFHTAIENTLEENENTRGIEEGDFGNGKESKGERDRCTAVEEVANRWRPWDDPSREECRLALVEGLTWMHEEPFRTALYPERAMEAPEDDNEEEEEENERKKEKGSGNGFCGPVERRRSTVSSMGSRASTDTTPVPSLLLHEIPSGMWQCFSAWCKRQPRVPSTSTTTTSSDASHVMTRFKDWCTALQASFAFVFSPMENMDGEVKVGAMQAAYDESSSDDRKEEEEEEKKENDVNPAARTSTAASHALKFASVSDCSWLHRLVRRYIQESPPLIQKDTRCAVDDLADPPLVQPLPSIVSSSLSSGRTNQSHTTSHVWDRFLSDDDLNTAIALDAAVRPFVVDFLGDLLGRGCPTDTGTTVPMFPVISVEDEECAALGCLHPSPAMVDVLFRLTTVVLHRWNASSARCAKACVPRFAFPPLRLPMDGRERRAKNAPPAQNESEAAAENGCGGKAEAMKGEAEMPMDRWLAVHLLRALSWMEWYTEVTHASRTTSCVPTRGPNENMTCTAVSTTEAEKAFSTTTTAGYAGDGVRSSCWTSRVISTRAVELAWQVTEDAAALLYTISLRWSAKALERYLFWNKDHLYKSSEQGEDVEESSESSEEEEDTDIIL